MSITIFYRRSCALKQDCIPVGCVPTAGWPYLGSEGRGVCLDAPQDVSITEREEVSVQGISIQGEGVSVQEGGGLCPGILRTSGWGLHLGSPFIGDWVAIWGQNDRRFSKLYLPATSLAGCTNTTKKLIDFFMSHSN